MAKSYFTTKKWQFDRRATATARKASGHLNNAEERLHGTHGCELCGMRNPKCWHIDYDRDTADALAILKTALAAVWAEHDARQARRPEA